MKQRFSNIELLRIIAMIGVIILHYNNAGFGGGYLYVKSGSINEIVLNILESISIVSVNIFVIISGYFLSNTYKRKIGKSLVLLFQVILYRLLHYIVMCLLGSQDATLQSMARIVLPTDWFVVLYCALYLISPLINHSLENIKNINTVMVLIISLFSIWPTAVDVVSQLTGSSLEGLSPIGINGSGRGYTIVNFIVCYYVGAYLCNSNTFFKKIKTNSLLIQSFLNIGIITVWEYLDVFTAREYCNPVLICQAAILVELFLRQRIKESQVINRIAEGAFSVYLLHGYLIRYFKVEKYVQSNVFCMALHLIITIMIITTLCIVIDFLYKKLFNRFLNRISSIGEYYI